jgi:hypothetical protein
MAPTCRRPLRASATRPHGAIATVELLGDAFELRYEEGDCPPARHLGRARVGAVHDRLRADQGPRRLARRRAARGSAARLDRLLPPVPRRRQPTAPVPARARNPKATVVSAYCRQPATANAGSGSHNPWHRAAQRPRPVPTRPSTTRHTNQDPARPLPRQPRNGPDRRHKSPAPTPKQASEPTRTGLSLGTSWGAAGGTRRAPPRRALRQRGCSSSVPHGADALPMHRIHSVGPPGASAGRPQR